MPAPAVKTAATEPAATESAGMEAAALEAAALEAAAMKPAGQAGAMREAASATAHRKAVPVIWIVVPITIRGVITRLVVLTILIIIRIAAINGSIGL
jgi:hypothetical protein